MGILPPQSKRWGARRANVWREPRVYSPPSAERATDAAGDHSSGDSLSAEQAQ